MYNEPKLSSSLLKKTLLAIFVVCAPIFLFGCSQSKSTPANHKHDVKFMNLDGPDKVIQGFAKKLCNSKIGQGFTDKAIGKQKSSKQVKGNVACPDGWFCYSSSALVTSHGEPSAEQAKNVIFVSAKGSDSDDFAKFFKQMKKVEKLVLIVIDKGGFELKKEQFVNHFIEGYVAMYSLAIAKGTTTKDPVSIEISDHIQAKNVYLGFQTNLEGPSGDDVEFAEKIEKKEGMKQVPAHVKVTIGGFVTSGSQHGFNRPTGFNENSDDGVFTLKTMGISVF